jgi:purine-binding chemotaxis protein CheW
MANSPACKGKAKQQLSEVLIFSLDEHRYCLPAKCVLEVVRAVPTQSVPNVPQEVEGIIDVHGTIVPVLSLRQSLGIPPKEPETTDHLIVINWEDQLLAIRVDRAIDVYKIEPTIATDTAEAYYENEEFIRTQDGIVIVLDLTAAAFGMRASGPFAITIDGGSGQ